MPFDENAYQRVSCNADTPVIRLSVGEKRDVSVVIRDENGDPVDLSDFREALPDRTYTVQQCDGAPVSAWDSSSSMNVEFLSSSSDNCYLTSLSSSAAGWVLEVKLRAATCLGGSALFTLDGDIANEENGEVTFSFTPIETARPGIMVASVAAFWRGILRFQQMFYLEFMANNFSATAGALTVPEVRMDMMDVCPDANYLIDSLEFTDNEIIHAMRKAVDFFNEANPPVGGYTYDSFPFRFNWLRGTSAFLLQMIAHRYRRNWLTYSAAGVTVADQERWKEYDTIGKQLQKEFADWVERKKVSINMGLGYGSIAPSPYGRGRHGRGPF